MVIGGLYVYQTIDSKEKPMRYKISQVSQVLLVLADSAD